jgi:deoxyribose-phosphate aldolase
LRKRFDIEDKDNCGMRLTANDIASMIDLSCVRTTSTKADIDEMVAAVGKYGFRHVSVLQCFIPYTKQLLQNSLGISIVGNVSFPSGSDSTSVKVAQARELCAFGCDEIDMVMNIGKLRSGAVDEVENDVRAVIETVHPLPVKVIIEIMYLSIEETMQACGICLRTGAAFIKTGTGWADRGTTVQDVQLVKSLVGDHINIKASGGIRSLEMLLKMYEAGARRFGVNLRSSVQIVEECLAMGSAVEVEPA